VADILDNRRLALVRDTEMVRSILKFVLDQSGTRRFVPSKRARQLVTPPLKGIKTASTLSEDNFLSY